MGSAAEAAGLDHGSGPKDGPNQAPGLAEQDLEGAAEVEGHPIEEPRGHEPTQAGKPGDAHLGVWERCPGWGHRQMFAHFVGVEGVP
jgi:hypothetical protein